ncbi:MAG: T9SS type A sorting domain-containing protein, partial [Candidatus Cloacimonetes bacterium]|nr:T9SS type A sorting domain-containing protein [Candidatus Cloacimonadota bacterium]
GFWIGNWDELGAITMSGAQIYGNINPVVASLYGSAYDSWTGDGPYLWIFSQTGGAVLHQFKIATQTFTGVTHNCSDVPGFDDGIAGGAATYEDDSGLFVLLVNIQQDPNLIAAYELVITADPDAPGAPTDVTVTPDAGGALVTEISWVCPTLTWQGNPLPELLEMRVYRDNELIYTDFEPVMGGPGNYTDIDVPSSGLYDYRVVGYNSWGEGMPVVETVWVGEDVPAAVENLLMTADPQTWIVTLTWDNPTTSLHGGAFNEPIIGYHIVRSDGVVFELTGIATTYVDDTIPVAGVYYYTVQAYNSVGDGGTATSNIWWPPVNYIYEDFSCSFPPDGWYIDGLGQTNWSASTSNNAGGYAPEAKFSWYPSFIGVSRLVSCPLYSVGYDYCWLEFNHFVNHYGGSYFLKIQTTSNGGATWNTGWELEVNSNIGPLQENIYFTTPDIGSDSLRIAFTFEGDSWNINYWYIDDVFCESCGYYIGYISLNVELQGGNGNIEDVEVAINNQTFHPDSLGNVFLELWQGNYDISAELTGYFPAFENNVLIMCNDTTYVDIELHFLEPPFNLYFEIVAPHVVLNWNAPQTALYVTGYKVYRDDELIAETTELYYMDGNVPIGIHEYYVTAKYGEYESGPSNIIEVELTEADGMLIPTITKLTGNYPNPFNPSGAGRSPETVIKFSIKDAGYVKLDIFNTKGQRVRILINNYLEPDFYNIIWNGKNNIGKNVSSGIYFYKLKAGEYSKTRKMLLLR